MTSCQLHLSCGQCVTSEDPLGCGWCYSKCLTQRECSQHSWHHQSCPPFIHQVGNSHQEAGCQTEMVSYLLNSTESEYLIFICSCRSFGYYDDNYPHSCTSSLVQGCVTSTYVSTSMFLNYNVIHNVWCVCIPFQQSIFQMFFPYTKVLITRKLIVFLMFVFIFWWAFVSFLTMKTVIQEVVKLD